MPSDQTFDAVIIGARCAGSAAAIALGRAGRRVLMIDRVSFPSDTLSTHVNFPSAVAEVQALGALDRVLECDPPKCHQGMVEADGARVLADWEPVDGIDYGICVPRTHFDYALVRTAVEDCGVELREKTSLVELVWEGERVVGALLRGPDGEYQVRSKLLVGADGRRSSVARMVGSEVPYRGSNNNRACAFFYMDDPKVGTEWRDRLIQLRSGPTHALIFPCPDDQVLCLFMGPREDVPRFRADPEAMWQEMLLENPAVAERLGGATNISKLRSSIDNPAFFRSSSGPGWILAGDAGHFKDPIIGQGMRDAMRFGRLWGEAAAPVIDDREALDRAMQAVEARRDRECLATYHWGNRESRVFSVSPLHRELLGGLGKSHPERFLHMFDRVEAPHKVLNPWVTGRYALKALLRPGVDRRALLRDIVEELRIDAGIWAEELRLRGRGTFRSARRTPDERADWQWPPERSGAVARAATSGGVAVEKVAG